MIEQAGLAAQQFPHLFGHVGCDRSEHNRQRTHLVDGRRPAGGADLVQQLHQGCDRGVERQAREIVGHLLDRGVQGSLDAGVRKSRRPRLDRDFHGVEGAVQETVRPHDRLAAKVAALVVGPEKHQVGAERVRAKALDVLVGDHHVAARLRHLRSVADQQAVLAEPVVRFFEREVPEVVQHHRDEP